MSAQQAIALAVRRSVQARDERGRHQAQRSLQITLARIGDASQTIDAHTAAAARAVGRAIAQRAATWRPQQ